MADILIPVLIQLFHDLFTALWIGGMLALAFTVLPSIKKVLGNKETKKQMQELSSLIKKKLSLLVYISMAGLMITGLLMKKRAGSVGFLNFDTQYATFLSIKHILYVVMVGLSIYRSRFIDNGKKFSMQKKQKLNMIVLLLNILIAVVVLFLSAHLSIMASLPVP